VVVGKRSRGTPGRYSKDAIEDESFSVPLHLEGRTGSESPSTGEGRECSVGELTGSLGWHEAAQG
jgi:hypothetical protein